MNDLNELRILITGATGFIGTHLIEFISNNTNAQIYGIDICDKKNLPLKLIQCDLMSPNEVIDCIDSIKPDYIFHLAAIASVPDAWKDPQKVLVNNTVCQLNILESLVKLNLLPRVLITSTGEVYGAVNNKDLPINENTRLKPNNPYAVSKVTQEFLGLQYFESYGIPVIITRSFNHAGPGQKGDFVVPSFVEQIMDIEQGKSEPVLRVGNLEAQRDFLDVRDVVRAYWHLIEKGTPGEVYNICSGKAIKIQKVLDIILANAKKDIRADQDPNRMRPSDTPVVIGDNSKLKKAISWQPEYNIEQTLIDALEKARIGVSPQASDVR